MRDESEALSIIDSERSSDLEGFGGARLLNHDTTVVMTLGGLDVVRGGVAEVMQLEKERFHFIGREQILRFAAACGDELEDTPEDGFDDREQGYEGIEFVQVLLCERGVDLNGETGLFCFVDGGHSEVPGAWDTSEAVMALACGSVDAER